MRAPSLNLLMLLALLLSTWNSFAAGSHDWVTPKLPTNFEKIDKADYAIGDINQQKYLAINLNVGDETHDGFRPVLVVARTDRDKRYAPVAVLKLATLPGPRIRIQNNAIYLRLEYGHHGIEF